MASEKSSIKVTLEEMSKEELITKVSRQVIFLQKAKAKCDELTSKVTRLEKEKVGLELQLEDLDRNTLAREERLQIQVEDCNQQISALKEARDSAVEAMKCANQKSTKVEGQKEEMMGGEEIDSLNEAVSLLQEESRELKDRLQVSMDECHKWKLKFEELENEKEDYLGPLAEVNELQSRIDELVNELARERSEKDICQLHSGEKRTKLANVPEEDENQVEDYGKELSAMVRQKEALSEELEQLRDLQRFLEDEARELRDESNRLKSQVEHLEANLENDSLHISRLDMELREAEEREKISQSEIELLRFQMVSKDEQELKSLKEEVQFHRSHATELERDNSDLLSSLDELKAERAEEGQVLEELRTHVQHLESRLADLEMEKADLDCRFSDEGLKSKALNESIAFFRAETERYEKEKALLEIDLSVERTNSSLRIDELEDWWAKEKLRVDEYAMKMAEEKLRSASLIEELRLKAELIDESTRQIEGLRASMVEYQEAAQLALEREKANESCCQVVEEEKGNQERLKGRDAIEIKCSAPIEYNEELRVNLEGQLYKENERATEYAGQIAELIEVSENEKAILEKELSQERFKVKELECRIESKKTSLEIQPSEERLKVKEILGQVDQLRLENKSSLQVGLEEFGAKQDQSKLAELEDERDKLKEAEIGTRRLLEEKTSLVGQIHHQMDSLVNRIDELSALLYQKENDLFSLAGKHKELLERLNDQQCQAQMMDGSSLSKFPEDRDELTLEELSKRNFELEGRLKDQGTELLECKDRIDKLKRVIFKSKKELADSHKMVAEMKAQKEEVMTGSRSHLLNFQSLQKNYDELQDECELKKEKLKKLEKDLSLNVSENLALKEKNQEMISEVQRLKEALLLAQQQKKLEEKSKAEMESYLIIVKSERESEETKFKAALAEKARLESKTSNLEVQLCEAREAEVAALLRFDEMSKESMQKRVMDLEIGHYEDSISVLEAKVEESQRLLEESQHQACLADEQNARLREEFGSLESKCLMEESRKECLKQVLDKTKAELAQSQESISTNQAELQSLQIRCENLTADREELKVELSNALAKVRSSEDFQKCLKENHGHMVKNLESRIGLLDQELKALQAELRTNQEDYDNYKVRVRMVLKQKQAGGGPTSPAQKDRLEKLVEGLKDNLLKVREVLARKEEEYIDLEEERNQLMLRHSKLVEELTRKDQSWTNRLEEMKREKSASLELWETEKCQLLLQKELLEKQFREEIRLLEERHAKDIHLLEKQLEEANNNAQEDPAPFDISTIERQSGEGSECTGSATPTLNNKSQTLNVGLTPLEELLQSELYRPISLTDQETLSNNLNMSQKKVDHLAELLNESEASNMKMAEQVRLLKEEIRRLERNKDREEITSNLEYLKNIVIKFLSLQEGNEREHLVPVLTTMLKLSPQEQQQLQLAANGEASGSDGVGGWGSYLPRWSGLM